MWCADLADMKSLRKNNRGIRYLLCAIDLFSKYAWGSNRKPNKVWVHQGGEFYNYLSKRFL